MLQHREEEIAQAIMNARKQFTVDLPGVGLFECHLGTFKDNMDVMAYQSNYIVSLGADPQQASTGLLYGSYLIAMVRVRVDKAPAGFVPEAADQEVLESLVQEILKYEDEFHEKRRDSASGTAEPSATEGPMGGVSFMATPADGPANPRSVPPPNPLGPRNGSPIQQVPTRSVIPPA